MGDFSHPRVCWRDNTAGVKQFKQFLECIDDNFLIEKVARGGALLYLICTNVEGLVWGGKVGAAVTAVTMRWSFRILQGGRRAKSRITTLAFSREDFGLSWDLSGRIPWSAVSKRRKTCFFQKSPSPSSREVHPNKQEVKQRWQEACINEQGASD